MDQKFYRQFCHDILNITGRLESVTSLLNPDAPPDTEDLALARRLIAQDSQKISHAMRLFCLTAWLQSSPQAEQADIDMTTLLQEIINKYMHDVANPIGLEVQGETCYLKSQQDVLHPLIEELVKNAVTHSAGSTTVDVKASWDKTKTIIEISNTPLAQMPENPEQPLNARPESPGIGMGLPFVFQAAKQLGATIEMVQEEYTITVKLTL